MKITPPPPPPSANIDTGRMSPRTRTIKAKEDRVDTINVQRRAIVVVQICSHVYVLL